MKAIRLERPLPLLVSAGECIYEIHADFEDATKEWHLAASKLGDGFAGWVTVGRPSNGELMQALAIGIEVAPGLPAALVATALVDQGRAEFVQPAQTVGDRSVATRRRNAKTTSVAPVRG